MAWNTPGGNKGGQGPEDNRRGPFGSRGGGNGGGWGGLPGPLKDLFDGGVASCEVHINKPDPRIYKALLDKYQLKAGESVFIDDRLENVQAAFRLGFAGIQMKDSVGTLVRSLATCSVVIHSTAHKNSPLNALSGALGGEFSAITDYFFS